MDSGPGEAALPEVLCAASGSTIEPLPAVAADSVSQLGLCEACNFLESFRGLRPFQ